MTPNQNKPIIPDDATLDAYLELNNPRPHHQDVHKMVCLLFAKLCAAAAVYGKKTEKDNLTAPEMDLRDLPVDEEVFLRALHYALQFDEPSFDVHFIHGLPDAFPTTFPTTPKKDEAVQKVMNSGAVAQYAATRMPRKQP